MKKRVETLILSSFLLIFLGGCQIRETVENNTEKMAGMEHIYADNEYGYYFDIYSENSKGKDRNGMINIEQTSDNLYFKVENAGKEREISIQIFLDYIQVPIIIDEKEYLTYVIDADEKYSEEFCFRFSNEIDMSVNHKLLAVMTASSDMNEINMSSERTTQAYSIAYDVILKLDGNNQNVLTDTSYDYEEPRNLYEDMWEGLLINNDLKNYKRTLPQKSINVKPNEEIVFQYHVGGYSDCQDVLIILSLDMKQIEVNSQNYIRCKVDNGKICNGVLKIKAPSEEGLYDLTGWVIKNPFSKSAPQYIPLSDTPRFTINVCE